MDTSKFIILDILENLDVEYKKYVQPSSRSSSIQSSPFLFGLRSCSLTNSLGGVYFEIYYADCLTGSPRTCVNKWLSNCWISIDGLFILTNDDEEELSNPNCVTLLCAKIVERYLNDKGRIKK